MKKSIMILAMALTAIAIPYSISGQTPSKNEQPETQNEPMAHLSLDSTYISMGNIPKDSIGEAIMGFTNTGDAPLQILRIFSECGCTVPSYSSDEVMPGERGKIKIRFNGKNRQPGTFRKALRVRTNAD
ncbi:MAG: DUF1573 domain-containing protein, partial [Muribaculaceae bacterium]|nr:DUF1573 domain-containing protein [Muribaculaceae bacterium]